MKNFKFSKFGAILILLVCNSVVAQIYHIQDMNTLEIEAIDRENTIILIPGGILEQHGPYLPSFSDGYMNIALTNEMANSFVKREGTQILIFPLIPLGVGGANDIGGKYSFEGTYSIRANTLRSILMDMGSEIGDQGFKKVFVIHMHGGPNHNMAIDQAAEFFHDQYNGTMINVWNLAFNASTNMKSEAERVEDGFTVHAGMDETSMLYFLKPELIQSGYLDAPSITGANFDDLIHFATEPDWPGYFGSPRLANAAYGEQLWHLWTRNILEKTQMILEGTYDFEQPTYFQIMNSDPSINSVITGSKEADKKREDTQLTWLKSKGLH